MDPPRLVRCLGAVLILFALAFPARSQEARTTSGGSRGHSWLMPLSGDQDVILYVSSIEWGSPDRWSFTSRYVHMFNKKAERDHKRWLHNLTVTLSPGTSGGRLGVGYQNVFSRLALLSEARVVLLRTWGNPLATGADRTLVGAEFRASLTGVVNVGTGYYQPVSGDDGDRGGLWGFHVGIGV
jgi:hypothetical protein